MLGTNLTAAGQVMQVTVPKRRIRRQLTARAPFFGVLFCELLPRKGRRHLFVWSSVRSNDDDLL